jgi:AhpD family alkylhydroperoxidase
MNAPDAFRYDEAAPEVFQALYDVHTLIQKRPFDRKVYYLVVLRASQVNGCVHCIDMHAPSARKLGETNERLDKLAVWEHADAFDAREKAALAWTEALTVLDRKADYGPLRMELRRHFSEDEIGTLTAMIAMINLWNRFRVSNH